MGFVAKAYWGQEQKIWTCELCGAHNRKLKIFSIFPDYIGWTCEECIDQIACSIQYRFRPSGEQTEPAE